MTTRSDIERILDRYLAEGAEQVPDRVIDAALDQIDHIPQRRTVRVPWRTPSVNVFSTALGRAAAIVIAVVAIGGSIIFLGSRNGIGGPPAATPTPAPTASPAPTTAPSASPGPTPVAKATAFTSARHGIKLTVPAGWTIQPATAPWPPGTEGAPPPDPMLDMFTAPDGSRFVVLSQKLPAGTSGAAWLATYETNGARSLPAACWPAPAAMTKATVNGQAAWIHGGVNPCGFTEAIVFAGGRIYELTGYPPVPFSSGLIFDKSAFDAFLASVTFDPSHADDTPVATPAAS
jgi:hypothetical protein